MRTHLDLFSGIGGFAIAAQACGYKTIGFCEREPYAQQILKERFGAVLADAESLQSDNSTSDAGSLGEIPRPSLAKKQQSGSASLHPTLHDNIFTLNGADYAGVDLLTGGFPCQPFSVAGKRLGKADDRAIWPEMLRVIREAQPTWIIGENVAGIVSMELDNILSDLEGIGYAAWPLVIPACAVDARHRRDRVWIVAHAGHLCGRGWAEPAGAERAEVANDGEDVADAKCTRPQGQRIAGSVEAGSGSTERPNKPSSLCGNEDVADAYGERGCVRPTGREHASDAGESPCTWKDEREWFAESGMGRVAHGIPNRAHRLRGLGNAIVPQVAEEIIRAITNLR